MDEIRIDNLKIFAHHGVFAEEKAHGQNFYVNAVLRVDAFAAGERDDLNLSVNYGLVCEFIEKTMTAKTYDLIETAAQAVALGILRTFDRVRSVDIEIRKPHAPIPLPFESVSVKISRAWTKAVVALGSNIGDSRKLISKAVERFRGSDYFRGVKVSELIVTKPYGYTDQPDFLNGAMVFETVLPPHALLDFMQESERLAKRTREIHWGPRTLDLDLILYGGEILSDERLTLPHPDFRNREFVLKPLCEIAPYLLDPVTKRTAAQLLARLEKRAERG
jgi:dihydroneopterin aldolase/2-amino-4-hydroxy-6-hydroxymethyldihydropteridine diphosphokinase